jgi:glycosyltransferase involved in cell wall biosynthesis
MLSVLHAYKVFAPDVVGGIPEVIRQLEVGLAGECRSEILVSRTRGLGSSETADGTPICRTSSLGSLASMPLAPTYPFHFWARARRVDVVAYHAPFPVVDLAVSMHFPGNTALVVHWHSEIVAQRKLLPLVAPLIRRTLHRADRIIVSSRAMIDRSPFLGPFAEKCAVIPYGIDLDQWASLSALQQARVAELRVRHPRLVVAAGRLVRYKGYDVLIESMRNVDGELMIVGAGPLEGALRRQVAGAGLSRRVHFAGFLPSSELKCLMHAARLFVLPSISDNEAFGIVQLEAMACGKAIVNTRLATGVPWVARDGEEAQTVTPGSVEELANAIRRFLDDGAVADAFGRRGRSRVAGLFERASFLDRTLATYQAAALRRQHPSADRLSADGTVLDQRIGR